jgi:hypothetical protein
MLKEAHAALNRNAIPGFVKGFDPQIERIEPAEFPGCGTYYGLETVKAHVSLHPGRWAEGSCEPITPDFSLIANPSRLPTPHVAVVYAIHAQMTF